VPLCGLGGFLACLLLLSCSSDNALQPQSTLENRSGDKARPGTTEWAGRARPFAHGIQVCDLAATTTHLFATTLGQEEKLVALDELGNRVTFSFEFAAPADSRCYVDVSPGWNDAFPVDEVWVSRGNELLRLSQQGDQMTSILTLPPAEGEIAGLCFDAVGSFEYALLLLSGNGNVFSLSSAAAPLHHIGSPGPGGRKPDVASLSFGAHAGQLLVSYPLKDVVLGVTPQGLVTPVIGWSGVSSALTVQQIVREFGRSQGALFMALENGRIYRFGRDDIAPLAGELLVSSLYQSGSGVVTPQGAGYSTRAFSRYWGAEVATALVRRPAVTDVEVSVQPGSSQPTFVHGSVTLVPVAVLSSPWFWPNLVDMGNVTLAGASAVPSGKGGAATWADLNDDGVDDLMLYFRPADMQVEVGNVVLPLQGQTLSTETFRGEAAVTVTAP
jgi:hypothetical protein